MTLVVVGADEGPHSEAAFKRVLHMFSRDSTHYHIATVRPDETEYQMDELYGVAFRDYWKELEAQRKKKSEEVLAKFRAIAEQANVKFTCVELVGDPREQLCRYCETVKADTLVVGSRGTGFLARLLLGSVSAYCTNHAPCAVLVDRCDVDNAASQPAHSEPVPSAGS